MSRRLRVIAAIAAAALVLPLGACSILFPPIPPSTSTPTDEQVDADLERYYHQELFWTDCGGGKQCATAEAPFDWSNPADRSIELALVRQPATSGKPIGSLLVNPGGPGGSGYNFVYDSVDFATSEALQSSFDIVGFDPRGVVNSSAVSCYSETADFDAFLFDLLPGEYGSDEWIAELEASNARFAEDCEANTGPLLGLVGTESAARDLDLLRAVLGDEKLNYLGYSYGTLLGATYAELYPTKTGRLVLDGALDPTSTSFDVSLNQAIGFENAMRAFLADCLTIDDCPFNGTVDKAMKSIRALLDRLNVSPLRNVDGRELGSNSMTIAMIYPLYSPDSWGALRDLFSEVLGGSAEYAFVLADAYYGRNDDGTYRDNSTEAFFSINCLDYSASSDLEVMRAEEAELVAKAPVLGQQLAFGGTTCAGWPYPPTREPGPIVAAGSADILVLGTTNDPATPYDWAVALADQLENGHLVTYEGEGHTAYNKGSSCVDDVVDSFFIDGKVPTSDPQC